MGDPTSLLFGLDEFRVVDVVRVDERELQVVIETHETVARCPDCDVPSSRIKDRARVRIKDLPVSGQRVRLWWRKRRLLCLEVSCPRLSFTEATAAIPPRSRLTGRLRAQLASAIAGSNRAVAEVAAAHGVGWHTAHDALVAAAARWLPTPPPIRVLGIDETRARRVRWLLEPAGWRRSDPWLTSFVDADTDTPGVLLGLAPGRSGACVRRWLGAQSAQFRAGIELVVIDPSAPYASGVRAALPHARIAVDHWHLVRLANEMVTEVRQRVARERHGRRGLKVDPVWAHRRMLLTAGDRLSRRQLARLREVLATDDPTNEIGAAWGCKELLRQLLAEHAPERIRHHLWRFYDACARADMPETTRLAATIETWWPAIAVALAERVTNARTEGFNRIIKQVKRVGCGFRNIDNYQRRIMAHIAVTRPRRDAA
jgi:transposase